MLLPTPFASSNWTFDNWGANPSTTIGALLSSPGTANTKGSYTQLAASADIANDVYAIYVQAHTGSSSTTARNLLMDIGVDPAGGTSYSVVIPNMQVGLSPSLTQAGAREHCFPLFIKAGSSVAARIQSSVVSITSRLAFRAYGYIDNPLVMPVGAYCDTFGANTGTSLGTSFTPGNAADGSWVSLGTTTRPYWWSQPGYSVNNGTVTAEYTYIEFAWGDTTNKHSIFKVMHGGTTSETCGLACQTHMQSWAAASRIPSGVDLYVRGRCNNAPDTGYNATLTCVGG